MQEQVQDLISRHLPGPFKRSGQGNVLTRCPFHKEGLERKPSFSIHLDKGLFHCFTCHVAGDVRYLLKLLGVPKSTIDAELETIQPVLDYNKSLKNLEKSNSFVKQDPFSAEYVLAEAILGIFEWEPTQLVEKGFDPSLLKEMEVGFDRNQQRITYPLRDLHGNLAGISGGATLPAQWPKYLVYQGGKKTEGGLWIPSTFGSWFDEEYPGYVCENHDFLWNYDRVAPRILSSREPQIIYVVEGFKACLWMLQHGYWNTVALMGSYISERQQQMLHRLGCTVVLFLDNDNAGRRGSLTAGRLLMRPMYGRVLVAAYPEEDDNTQPDSYNQQELSFIIQDSKSYQDYKTQITKKYPFLIKKTGEINKWQ